MLRTFTTMLSAKLFVGNQKYHGVWCGNNFAKREYFTIQFINVEPFSDREQSSPCSRTTCVAWCLRRRSSGCRSVLSGQLAADSAAGLLCRHWSEMEIAPVTTMHHTFMPHISLDTVIQQK